MMHRLANRDLQVSCPRKRWRFAIGSHHNIIVAYSRYPLEGVVDIGDLHASDFALLSKFFEKREPNSILSLRSGKWSFMINGIYELTINFTHHPFNGVLQLGELAKEHSIQLAQMFTKARQL